MAIGTTAAILASAAVSAGSSAYGASQQSKAAKNAAAASQQATDSANATQLQMYNQTRADQEPWRQVGIGALGQMAQLYGISMPAPMGNAQGLIGDQPISGSNYAAYVDANPDLLALYNSQGGMARGRTKEQFGQYHYQGYGAGEGRAVPQFGTPANIAAPAQGQAQQAPGQAMPGNAPAGSDPRFANFFASPDYQFRLSEGNRNLNANAATTGTLQSGAAQKALQNYGQNMASGEYGNYYNKLSALAGVGQTANSANQAAGGAYAGATNQNLMNNASNKASSYGAIASANGQAAGQIAGSVSNAFMNMGGSNAGAAAQSGWNAMSQYNLPNGFAMPTAPNIRF